MRLRITLAALAAGLLITVAIPSVASAAPTTVVTFSNGDTCYLQSWVDPWNPVQGGANALCNKTTAVAAVSWLTYSELGFSFKSNASLAPYPTIMQTHSEASLQPGSHFLQAEASFIEPGASVTSTYGNGSCSRTTGQAVCTQDDWFTL